MIRLNIDFQSLFDNTIDAYTHVLGEEYREIISKRIKRTAIIQYHDIEGLKDYIYYIRDKKNKELTMKFLSQIYDNVNETTQISDVYNEINALVGGASFAFDTKSRMQEHIPLRAFYNYKYDEDKKIGKQLRVINFLLNDEHNKVTRDSYEEFKKTKEYQKIMKKINHYIEIYVKLYEEYSSWEKDFEFCDEIIEEEENKKNDILEANKKDLLKDIIELLPKKARKEILSKTQEVQYQCIFNDYNLESNCCYLEYFTKENIDKLKDSNESKYIKLFIIHNQIEYLKRFDMEILENKYDYTNEEIELLLKRLEDGDLKEYIPSEEKLIKIHELRKNKYDEAMLEYYRRREDFQFIMKNYNLSNDDSLEKFIYYYFKNQIICITSGGGTKPNGEYVGLMFYTIRQGDYGYLSFNYLHEMGHIIEHESMKCGFEDHTVELLNPYDNKKRKYERFNETINDIFSMEAKEYLESNGIYFIEPKEHTKEDLSNTNTSSLLKKILEPLFERFRAEIIKSKLTINPNVLISCIGENNYEELVDYINRVDYLVRKSSGCNMSEEKRKEELRELREKVLKLYEKIDEYSNKPNILTHKF